jgi:hypothetical protein
MGYGGAGLDLLTNHDGAGSEDDQQLAGGEPQHLRTNRQPPRGGGEAEGEKGVTRSGLRGRRDAAAAAAAAAVPLPV